MMNERIRKIEDQAWEQVTRTDGLVLTDDFNQKFAELIVREMCDVFDKRAEPGTGFYEPHEPAELIKQHFGVEE